MARDGAGNFLLPAGNPVVTGTVVSSNDFNLTMAEVRDALTQSISKDGQTTPTANLPMGGQRHTGVGDGTQGNHYASVKQLQTGATALVGSVTNATDAYTGSLTPTISTYVDGMYVTFTPTASNTTTTPTLALNGLAAKTIVKDGGAVVIGDLVLNKQARLTYQATPGQWILNNPATLTITDASLSSNVVLKNSANVHTALNTFNAPSTTPAIQVQGSANHYSVSITGAATSGQAFGLLINAGSTTADVALQVANQANSQSYLTVRGDGALTVAGTAAFNGNAMTLSGSAPQFFFNSSTTGASYASWGVSGVARGFVGTGVISGAATNDFNIRSDLGNIAFSPNSGASVTFRITQSGPVEVNDAGTFRQVGYQGVPVQAAANGYVLGTADNGKVMDAVSGTIIIPSNAANALPIGFSVVIDNDTGNTIAININSDTLVQVGTNATGNRSLNAFGQAILVKKAATRWRISGINLT